MGQFSISANRHRQSALESAMAGARRTSKLAEQLLTLGRLSAGGDPSQQQLLSIADLCRDVIAAAEPLLDRRGQTIGLDVQQDCLVLGEPTQLQRMLQNLIDNASVHGAPHGDIQVTVDTGADVVLLGIANDGVPIPEQQWPHLFTPYYRMAGAQSGGYGLGLAIVREIVELHRGKIVIQARGDGCGTIVLVTLPCAAPAGGDPSCQSRAARRA